MDVQIERERVIAVELALACTDKRRWDIIWIEALATPILRVEGEWPSSMFLSILLMYLFMFKPSYLGPQQHDMVLLRSLFLQVSLD